MSSTPSSVIRSVVGLSGVTPVTRNSRDSPERSRKMRLTCFNMSESGLSERNRSAPFNPWAPLMRPTRSIDAVVLNVAPRRRTPAPSPVLDNLEDDLTISARRDRVQDRTDRLCGPSLFADHAPQIFFRDSQFKYRGCIALSLLHIHRVSVVH